MIDEKDFKKIRDYVIRVLPEIIREEPEVAATIEGILARQFPRRDEFARLLDEVRENRREMDQRFEQVDQRFEQVDRRFEEAAQDRQAIREDMDRRFEQAAQDRQAIREDMDRRFEQARQERLDLKRDIARIHSRQENLIKKMDGHMAWSKVIFGDWGTKKGQDLEVMFAAGLRYGLNEPGINPESIHLRQPLVDSEGLVFRKGLKTEVDIVAQNDRLIVFEVKTAPKAGEVDWFDSKLQLVKLQNPDKEVRGVFICPGPRPEVVDRCAELGVELID